MCKRLIFILLIMNLTFFFGKKLVAQNMNGGGAGYFMLGGNIIKLENLNSELEKNGYSKLEENFFSLGGGGYGIIGKVIIGGEGHGLIGKEVTSGSYKTLISAGYGFFNLGYIAYSNTNLNIYPLFGIGGGGISLRILEEGSLSFDEVLANPKRGVELSKGSLLLNLAIGGDYLLGLKENEEAKGGFILGVRLGYTIAPINGNWEMKGIEISGGPDLGVTGPYIRIQFGGGGFGFKR
ncbi:MAG: hypothetical protein ABIN61_08360 [candidate division WOR-3 bacterium]